MSYLPLFLPSCVSCCSFIPSLLLLPSSFLLFCFPFSFLDVHDKKVIILPVLPCSLSLSVFLPYLPSLFPSILYVCDRKKIILSLVPSFLVNCCSSLPLFFVPLFHLHFIHPSIFFLPPFFSFLPSFLPSYLPSYLFDPRSSFFAFSLLSFLPHFLPAILLSFLLPSLLSSFPFFMYGRKKGGAQKKQ